MGLTAGRRCSSIVFMAERDAFGREKGQDPLEDLGWSTSGAANRASGLAVPVPREELRGAADVDHEGIPGTHAPAPKTFQDRKPSGGGLPGGPRQLDLRGLRIFGRVLRGLIVLAIVLGVAVGGGTALIDEISDEVDKIDTFNQPEFSSPATPEVGEDADPEPASPPAAEQPAAPDEPPVGLQRGSLLLRANFATVLAKMRTGRYGRLVNLRVAPERIDAQFVTKGGRMRSVQFQPGGEERDFGTSGPGFTGARTMTIASIDPAAPFRAARSAAGRLRKPVTQVNYLVYTDVFAGQPWGVYFKGGQYFRADGRGTITRRFN